MTTIQLIMVGIIFAWGAWSLILVVRRSWTDEDCDMSELSGYVIFALGVIVIVGLLLKLIGLW